VHSPRVVRTNRSVDRPDPGDDLRCQYLTDVVEITQRAAGGFDRGGDVGVCGTDASFESTQLGDEFDGDTTHRASCRVLRPGSAEHIRGELNGQPAVSHASWDQVGEQLGQPGDQLDRALIRSSRCPVSRRNAPSF
jgi:hypothetical protein